MMRTWYLYLSAVFLVFSIHHTSVQSAPSSVKFNLSFSAQVDLNCDSSNPSNEQMVVSDLNEQAGRLTISVINCKLKREVGERLIIGENLNDPFGEVRYVIAQIVQANLSGTALTAQVLLIPLDACDDVNLGVQQFNEVMDMPEGFNTFSLIPYAAQAIGYFVERDGNNGYVQLVSDDVQCEGVNLAQVRPNGRFEAMREHTVAGTIIYAPDDDHPIILEIQEVDTINNIAIVSLVSGSGWPPQGAPVRLGVQPISTPPEGMIAVNNPVGEFSFYIDTHPVTNGDFRTFIDAGGYTTERWWSSDSWQWRNETGTTPLMPAGANESTLYGVTWYEADAYCRALTENEGLTGFATRLPDRSQWDTSGIDPVNTALIEWLNDSFPVPEPERRIYAIQVNSHEAGDDIDCDTDGGCLPDYAFNQDFGFRCIAFPSSGE